MTTLRPERPADGPMSYEDTGQFAAVVQQLDDPLNDPLPGRPPVVRDREPRGVPADLRAPAPPVPDLREESAPRVREWGPVAPPFYDRPLAADQPSAPGAASPWFRTPGAGDGRTAPAAGAEPARSELFAGPQAAPQAPFAPQGTEGRAAFAPGGPVRPEAFTRPERPTAPEGSVPAGPGEPGMFARPEPPRRPQGPRRGLSDTAQLPVVPAAPDAAAPEQPAQDALRLAGAESAPGPVPEDGGRAARRRAAQRQSGHRSRGRGAGPAGGAAAEAAEAFPMSAGAQGSSAAEAAPPRSRVEARRAAKAAKDSPSVVISRVLGEVFITTGVIMLLFVTYQLWWSNIRAHQQANSASNKLEHQWDATQPDPSRAAGTFSPGQGFAIMYIPKLDVKAPIAQGVDKTSVLDKGMIGHYDGALNTAMPWDKTGNFAVAAHRNTHGEPFRYINHLTAGDKVVVETATTYYTYEITTAMASTPPSNITVLQPVPPGSGFTQPGRYLTLTTCTPEFTSTNRLIVWGKLIEERARSKGKPDALVQG